MTQRADPDIIDIFVIGGGINGCGIARDAAGRGRAPRWSMPPALAQPCLAHLRITEEEASMQCRAA